MCVCINAQLKIKSQDMELSIRNSNIVIIGFCYCFVSTSDDYIYLVLCVVVAAAAAVVANWHNRRDFVCERMLSFIVSSTKHMQSFLMNIISYLNNCSVGTYFPIFGNYSSRAKIFNDYNLMQINLLNTNSFMYGICW